MHRGYPADVVAVLVLPGSLACALVEGLEPLTGALRGDSIFGEESIQIHLGDRATAALDTDRLGRRPLQVRGNLLLGQPALLSQTDELAAEKSALNNWSLISGDRK